MKTPSVSPNIQAYDAIIHPFQVRQQTKYLAVVPLHNLHVNTSIILKEKEVRSANTAGPLLFFANLFNLETDIII